MREARTTPTTTEFRHLRAFDSIRYYITTMGVSSVESDSNSVPMTTKTMLNKMKNFEMGIQIQKKTFDEAREEGTGYPRVGGVFAG